MIQGTPYSVLDACHFLRPKLWEVLLEVSGVDQAALLELSDLYKSLVSPEDLKQIKADVNRNVHFHPFVKTVEF